MGNVQDNSNKNEIGLFIKNYAGLKPILRYIFIYGCYNRADFQAQLKISARKYDQDKQKIFAFLSEEYFRDERQNRKRILRFEYDLFNIRENYMRHFYSIKSVSYKWTKIYLCLLQNIARAKQISYAKLLVEFDQLYPSFALEAEEQSADIGAIKRRLRELTENGWILDQQPKKQRNHCYLLHKDIFCTCSQEEMAKLVEAIKFFCMVLPVSVPGYTLLNLLNYYGDKKLDTESKALFTIKDKQLQQIIDEDSVFLLMQAIKAKKVVSFFDSSPFLDAAKKKTMLKPVKIYFDSPYSRWYILGIDAATEEIVSYRLDYLEKLHIEEESFDEQLDTDGFLANAWNLYSATKKTKSKLEITITLPRQKAIRHLLQQHLDERKSLFAVRKISADQSVYTATLKDLTAIKPWLRTFAGYLQINAGDDPEAGKLKQALEAEWQELKAYYGNFQ